nr:type II toxin-antitoxin system HicB family antitoxin [Paenibacillus xylanexedens]
MIRTYKYYAILNFADDGINVSFPDLPGCLTYGHTLEEALIMAKDALELYLDGETVEKPWKNRGKTPASSDHASVIKP